MFLLKATITEIIKNFQKGWKSGTSDRAPAEQAKGRVQTPVLPKKKKEKKIPEGE
jgi:hypothetical protein